MGRWEKMEMKEIKKRRRANNKFPFWHYSKETFLLSFCKWEFLRRNEAYRKDYDSYLNTPGTADFYKVNGCFLDKWGIYPADYKKTLSRENIENLTYKRKFDSLRIPNFIASMCPPVHCLTPEAIETDDGKIIDYEPIPDEDLANINEIDLRINLSTHKTATMKAIEEIIDRWQKRKKEYGKAIISPIRIDDWEFYWKIYDLKEENKEITFKEISIEVFSDDTRNGEDRTSKAYKKCCELINGGYRKISL